MSAAAQKHINETTVIVLVALIYFINIVDFMMVMPLGPDLAHALSIDPAHLGVITGCYSVAIALVALAGARFFDRFDRRSLLLVSLTGLGLCTMAAALASDLEGLLLARVGAGIFAAPMTTAAMAIIADQVPEQRRGRAIGLVSIGFTAAAVAGVPIGLELARWFEWHTPFIVVGVLSLLICAITAWKLPTMRAHIEAAGQQPFRIKSAVSQPAMLVAWVIAALSMFSSFLLIPHFSSIFQFNYDYPREGISTLYMVGGLIALVGTNLAGRCSDRFGAPLVSAVTSVLFVSGVVALFVLELPAPIMLVFISFMVGNTSRNVAVQTLASRVPAANQRAGFNSLASATRHMASGLAAVISTAILVTQPDGRLDHVLGLSVLSITSALLVPPLMYWLARLMSRRETKGVSLGSS